MNVVQRLFSNTLLAFIGSIIVKASNSLLFIFIGRLIGPAEAGIFNLAATYFTIIFALSDWGLHELLIREVAPRREESGRFLINYAAMRLLLAATAYAFLLLFLRLNLPYTEHTTLVIRLFALSLFPEAIFSLCQGLFFAHEKFFTPTLAAIINSGLKLTTGFWLLYQGSDIVTIAWVMPISSSLSLLVFVPALFRLFKQVPQQVRVRLGLRFSLSQLRYTPGFIIIGLFLTLDFQLDALLISFFLTEVDLGWYGAAQTIMLGFWMMPLAIRSAIYPLMARYYYEEPAKLGPLYRKASRYLLAASLPIVAGISLLARPIVELIFGTAFAPTTAALQWMIWAVVFAFLNVPNARLMLVHNRQQQAGWMTGLSMVANLSLNLWLIPRYGITGAAVARTVSSFILFLSLYLYVQRRLLRDSLLPLVLRPGLATVVMAIAVWQLPDYSLFLTIFVGMLVYITAAFLFGVVPREDRQYIHRLVKI